ncbi:hypothetical protein [Thiolapillus sp.]|uniref:hypothetical protein n=1 Tax=Thiolapillus sp. TaxID=2017437 RepID=UPI0025F458B2|nr:hypothetical protein [Thiolapillus sp.]
MEIVLAVLLLFGGFALGSATADKRDDVEPPSMTVSAMQAVPDSVRATQDMRKCRSGKSDMYRDLTVPYIGQKDQAVPKANTCEGACTDE